ncbi:dTDP-4-dehydrorhamnose reductase [Methylobacter luteus]|uniref:dTDP-4-dehydrorhamnose reductase n=1 Tax=Methylobacter luteus TaxID=415 RepID=UPI000403C835|nr:dTDP-4-dehydrorhamnose reductase [Methylobacter luteus]
MKILLTGCNGQVGWELARALLPLGDVIAVSRSQVELSDPDGLRRIVQKVSPDVIVNPAAYTAVDKAETDRDMAFLINAEAPRVLAEEAAKRAALLIHYSTDYVFDGTKNAPYTEDDATHPVNVYGQSKLAGEQAIQAAGADHLILRTSWVYAARGQNFLKTILRLAAEREELAIVADQIGSPTWARLIAETTAHILRQSLQERRQDHFNSGVYNLTSVGETSWHGFAQAIVEIARQQGMPALKNRIINPIPTTAYPVPAKRPLNSRLSTDRLEQRFGLKMPSWDAALRLCMADMT